MIIRQRPERHQRGRHASTWGKGIPAEETASIEALGRAWTSQKDHCSWTKVGKSEVLGREVREGPPRLV